MTVTSRSAMEANGLVRAWSMKKLLVEFFGDANSDHAPLKGFLKQHKDAYTAMNGYTWDGGAVG